MNRRSFLQSAAMAASALLVDPERLLWTPGKKTIFVPPAPKSITLAEYMKSHHDPQVSKIVELLMRTNEHLFEMDLWQSRALDQLGSGAPVYRKTDFWKNIKI